MIAFFCKTYSFLSLKCGNSSFLEKTRSVREFAQFLYIGRSRNLYLNDSYKIPSSAHRSETLSFQFDLSDKAEN
ncbi:hypothetical protein LEP1GSC137_0300 [Leptospira borgpetersenii str. Noumea 25]|uniref:Uncharacterized protein n=1 Tax=Leptospira borgpetersenii serovar Ballum TaxID=280505 RepID=A0A0S2IX04_LEPBO|nr:hypothetical protein LBBP_04059 [Leptospira borgpetersenii serovar Ballum]EMO09471.1 hypothetical protein LEP1GSC137_0300 [Leptospira borgpetersenii str. Noumea 25]